MYRKLGQNFQVTHCNGQISPFSNTLDFEISALGMNEQKEQAKFKVVSNYSKEDNMWVIDKLQMLTKSDMKCVIV